MNSLLDPRDPTLPPSEILPPGRDEMNLAEFPIALLSDRAPKGQKAIKFQDQIYDKLRNEIITRKVIIEGSEEYGLPTAVDDEVVLALLQLSKQSNDFASREVQFTRLQLVNTLGWPNDGRSYRRIALSLQRIASITLHYENSWWDKKRRTWTTRTFHIIDNVEINDSRAAGEQQKLFPAYSRIAWNEVIFDSFQAGFLKSLDYALCVSLKLSTSKRIYRFMDKRFYHKSDWTFDLKDFAYEHIGLSRRYEGNAHLVRKLQPAIDELTEVNFLETMGEEERYQKNGKTWMIRLVRKRPSPALPRTSLAEPPIPFAQELVARGVTVSTAAELVRRHPPEMIEAKLEVYDWLVEKADKRVQKSPAGYLVDSIRKDYAPPKGFESRAERARREDAERRAREKRVRKAQEDTRQRVEHQAVIDYWNSLSEKEQKQLDLQALAAADPDKVEDCKRIPPLERMFRISIRHEYIQKLLTERIEERGRQS